MLEVSLPLAADQRTFRWGEVHSVVHGFIVEVACPDPCNKPGCQSDGRCSNPEQCDQNDRGGYGVRRTDEEIFLVPWCRMVLEVERPDDPPESMEDEAVKTIFEQRPEQESNDEG